MVVSRAFLKIVFFFIVYTWKANLFGKTCVIFAQPIWQVFLMHHHIQYQSQALTLTLMNVSEQ